LLSQNKRRKFLISDKVHPQTISVVETRASSMGMEVVIGNVNSFDFSNRDVSGVLFQYPDTEGNILDFSELVVKAHTNGVSQILTFGNLNYKLPALFDVKYCFVL